MKTALLTLLTVCALLAPAKAQNLLVNGDFETGQLTPWTGGTIAVDPAGGFFCTTSGTLTQTVATTAGTRYFVSADILASGTIGLTSASISATPTAGGAPDGTRSIPTNIITPTFVRSALVFTASSASTNINFSSFAIIGPNSITVDDAVMQVIEPSKLVGKYSGSIATTLSLTNVDLSNKSVRKVVARVTEDNRIFILDGTQTILAGIILNDGTFDLTGQTNSSGGGKANIRGKRIELEFNSISLIASDTTGAPVPNLVTNKIVLTRR